MISVGTYLGVSLALILAGGLAATVFTIYYGLAAPWWKSPEGINLFGFTATIAAVLDLQVLLRIAGEFPGARILALVIFASIAAFLTHRLVLVWMRQHSCMCLHRRASDPRPLRSIKRDEESE